MTDEDDFATMGACPPTLGRAADGQPLYGHPWTRIDYMPRCHHDSMDVYLLVERLTLITRQEAWDEEETSRSEIPGICWTSGDRADKDQPFRWSPSSIAEACSLWSNKAQVTLTLVAS